MTNEVFEYNPQGSRLRGGIVYKQILINAELQIRKTKKETKQRWLGEVY